MAPIIPPAAAPPAAPVKVLCWVWVMSAHPANMATRAIIPDIPLINRMRTSFRFLVSLLARPLGTQKPEFTLHRRFLHILRIRLGPLDEHSDRFVARGRRIGHTDQTHITPVALARVCRKIKMKGTNHVAFTHLNRFLCPRIARRNRAEIDEIL